jgi:hypothetical protein
MVDVVLSGYLCMNGAKRRACRAIHCLVDKPTRDIHMSRRQTIWRPADFPPQAWRTISAGQSTDVANMRDAVHSHVPNCYTLGSVSSTDVGDLSTVPVDK